MGEVVVSIFIGSCLIVSGILMKSHLKKEEESLKKR